MHPEGESAPSGGEVADPKVGRSHKNNGIFKAKKLKPVILI